VGTFSARRTDRLCVEVVSDAPLVAGLDCHVGEIRLSRSAEDLDAMHSRLEIERRDRRGRPVVLAINVELALRDTAMMSVAVPPGCDAGNVRCRLRRPGLFPRPVARRQRRPRPHALGLTGANLANRELITSGSPASERSSRYSRKVACATRCAASEERPEDWLRAGHASRERTPKR
jgi:hypothetical protein